MDYRRTSGAIIFVAAAQFLTGMHLAEFLYPGYSVSGNYISDLGVQQQSATIFNFSVALLGILLLLCSYFIWREFKSSLMPVLLGLAGGGSIGVGLFPGTAGMIHEIVASIAFLFGGFSAIGAFRLVRAPFTYFSVILGIISLAALGLFASGNYLWLGPGGMERMIVYPVMLWAAGFGGYLMSGEKTA